MFSLLLGTFRRTWTPRGAAERETAIRDPLLPNLCFLPAEQLIREQTAERITLYTLKVSYYTTFRHIGSDIYKYIKNMSLKCFAQNTKQITHSSLKPVYFQPSLTAFRVIVTTFNLLIRVHQHHFPLFFLSRRIFSKQHTVIYSTITHNYPCFYLFV